jgi:hypothetical protein
MRRQLQAGLAAALLATAALCQAQDTAPGAATPRQRARQFCTENPDQCQQLKDYCKENRAQCRQARQRIQARRQELQQECRQDPATCEQKKQELRQQLQSTRPANGG